MEFMNFNQEIQMNEMNNFSHFSFEESVIYAIFNEYMQLNDKVITSVS